MSAVLQEQTTTCDVCGEPVTYTDAGRPRKYCGNACKTKAWRIRQVLRDGLKSLSRAPVDLDYEDEHRVA